MYSQRNIHKAISICFPLKMKWPSWLPQGTKGKLVSVTLYRGVRTFTLFFTDEPPTLTLYYYNAFNVYDTLYLTAQAKRKLSFDRSTAICCGQSSSYDGNTEVNLLTR